MSTVRCRWQSAVRLGVAGLMLAASAPAAAAPLIRTAPTLGVLLADVASADADRLTAECVRLKADLDRRNEEISALKRGDRGVRDDYRLRRLMAEAETIARRLTEAEAELRRLRGPVAPAAAPAAPPPSPNPHDAPAVLAAKADILTDQARRLAVQAETLSRAASQARTRQTLRRRAGQLERDPFASLEGAKRFLVVPGRGTASDLSAGGARRGAGASTTETDTAAADSSRTTAFGPPTASGGGAPATGQPGNGNTPPPAAPAPESTTKSGTSTTGAPAPAAPAPSAEAVTRLLLDPGIAAELRRLEAGGRTLSDSEKLEHAAAALRARARLLDEQARNLRSRAKP